MASKTTDFAPEVRAQRAYDYEEIKKILGKQAYLMSANRREEELDTLWTKENTETASYGRNWGYYIGLDNIRAWYVGQNPIGAPGTCVCRPFTTHKIHIADDGKTAQATWYSIGYETIQTENGPKGYWDDCRCGADLILEADGWKIWHFFSGSDFALEPGVPYANLKVFERTEADELNRKNFGEPTLAFEAYTADYNYYSYPKIATEYATFAETVSNGPEGNPKYPG